MDQSRYTMEELVALSTETLILPEYGVLISGLPITTKYDRLLSILTGTVLDEPGGKHKGRKAGIQIFNHWGCRPVKVVLYWDTNDSCKTTTGEALVIFSPECSLERIIKRTDGFRIDKKHTLQARLSHTSRV